MIQEKDMGFHSGLGIKGLFHLTLRDKFGNLKEERIVHNTVTELGDAHVADQLADVPDEAQLGYMAVGTGTGQLASDTGLAILLDRNALTSTTQGAGAADNDLVFVGDWAAGDGTGAITEAGIFVGNDNTSMNYYADFAVVNKAAGDTLSVTWTVTYGAS